MDPWGGRDNGRMWNRPSGAEIKPTTIGQCLNAALAESSPLFWSQEQFLSNKSLKILAEHKEVQTCLNNKKEAFFSFSDGLNSDLKTPESFSHSGLFLRSRKLVESEMFTGELNLVLIVHLHALFH